MNNNNHRKIWISGSRGFIGRYLVSELENICEIKCLSNTIYEKTFDHDVNPPIFVDFQREKDISNIIENLGVPDVFIHSGWGGVGNPHAEVHLGDNVSQSKNLIKVLYKAGLDKFVFLGSMDEYGDQRGSLYENMVSKGRITNYAKGKIAVAKFGFEMAKEMNKKFVHIRLFYTYGPLRREGTLIQDLYRGYKMNKVVSLGHCERYRDYIYLSDTLKGIRLLSNIEESTTVNLGSGKAIKLKEFVNIFWKKLGGKPEMLQFGDKPMGEEQTQPNYANLDKLQKLTGGWKPSISIEDGIQLTIKELDRIYSKTSM